MLSISLEPEEYITINSDIVIQVSKMVGGRCVLAIEADRSIPIMRSAVLERNGTPPPACIASRPPRKKPRYKPEAVFRWNDDRERAVRMIEKVAARLEENGEAGEAKILRNQLEQIVPAIWEDEVPMK